MSDMRAARETMLIGLALAVPYVAAGLLSPGPYAGKSIQAGLIILVAVGVGAAWLWSRGKRADQEQDERERAIVTRSAYFAFFVTAITLQGYYAWHVAVTGPNEPSFWLVTALWGSFASAYVYNRVRM
jgi:hypothetical protein